MEITISEKFRAMIYYNFYCDLTPSTATVYRLYTEFKRGRSSLKHEVKEGRPNSVVVPKNVVAVRKLVVGIRHVTYSEMECLSVSTTRIHKILHEHLGVRKTVYSLDSAFVNRTLEKARVDWCGKISSKYSCGASKAVYSVVTGEKFHI